MHVGLRRIQILNLSLHVARQRLWLLSISFLQSVTKSVVFGYTLYLGLGGLELELGMLGLGGTG